MRAAAIEELVPVVQRVCGSRLRGWSRVLIDADDVAQDALCSLLRASQRRPVPMTPEYAARAAANHAVDASRSAYRTRRQRMTDDILADTPDPTAGPEELAVRAAMARQVAGWLGELSELQRRVVILRVALGMSAEETAAATGSTPGAVRVHQHRALTRLRELAGGAL